MSFNQSSDGQQPDFVAEEEINAREETPQNNEASGWESHPTQEEEDEEEWDEVWGPPLQQGGDPTPIRPLSLPIGLSHIDGHNLARQLNLVFESTNCMMAQLVKMQKDLANLITQTGQNTDEHKIARGRGRRLP